MNTRPLVIYHKSCADGFGAAFAVWLKLADTADYVPLQYGFKLEELPDVTGRVVYIVDFSLPKDIFAAVLSQALYTYWFDHHKTAFEMWVPERPFDDKAFCHEVTEKSTIVLDNSRSGARLTFEMMFPAVDTPMLFHYLDDYDRWQFKHKGTKPFNKALWATAPWSFAQWDDMITDPVAMSRMVKEGEALLKAHQQNVDSVVASTKRLCRIVPDDGIERVGFSSNCPSHLQSDVGHILATESNTYGLLWTIGKDGPNKVKCSLRSNGDYDVSYLARLFGGGGHKNAAGFETTIERLLTWIS